MENQKKTSVAMLVENPMVVFSEMPVVILAMTFVHRFGVIPDADFYDERYNIEEPGQFSVENEAMLETNRFIENYIKISRKAGKLPCKRDLDSCIMQSKKSRGYAFRNCKLKECLHLYSHVGMRKFRECLQIARVFLGETSRLVADMTVLLKNEELWVV